MPTDIADGHQEPTVHFGQLVEVATDLGAVAGGYVALREIHPEDYGEMLRQQALLQREREVMLHRVGAHRLHGRANGLPEQPQHRIFGVGYVRGYHDIGRFTIGARRA